jgi:hypothetical protein
MGYLDARRRMILSAMSSDSGGRTSSGGIVQFGGGGSMISSLLFSLIDLSQCPPAKIGAGHAFQVLVKVAGETTSL